MRRTALYSLFSTHAKICIIGGGTGGLNLSTHLMRAQIPAEDIRIIEPAEYHYYQPGWTMLGANLCSSDLTLRKMDDILPWNIKRTRSKVTRIDAENNAVHAENGQTITYDNLIVSSGLRLQYEKIKGAKQALDDPTSQVSTIFELRYAEKLAQMGDRFKGGKAIFTEPPHPIKCGGTPQKILYLWSDSWIKRSLPIEIEFFKAGATMFGVPKYAESLTKVAKNYGISTHLQHNLVQIKDNKTALFKNLQNDEIVERKFDFLHFIPPMGAHEYIQQSGLADGNGYLDVDMGTLRHKKYRNLWGLGDCTNTPNSKTAAAVFSQTETLVENLMAARRNPEYVDLPSVYEGYASCPIFTAQDKLILAEFKYDGGVDETFFSDQEKPRYIFFLLKRYFFPHVYWNLVPRGLWGGRKGIKIDI